MKDLDGGNVILGGYAIIGVYSPYTALKLFAYIEILLFYLPFYWIFDISFSGSLLILVLIVLIILWKHPLLIRPCMYVLSLFSVKATPLECGTRLVLRLKIWSGFYDIIYVCLYVGRSKF